MTTRSSWKGPFIDETLLYSIRYPKKFPVKTMSRSSMVLPSLLGKTIQIHNGKFFLPVSVSESMLGRKLGEFCFTRSRHVYKKKKKKK
jgi:small subunit ribosomal protein S19